VFLTPIFFYVIQRLGERRRAAAGLKDDQGAETS